MAGPHEGSLDEDLRPGLSSDSYPTMETHIRRTMQRRLACRFRPALMSWRSGHRRRPQRLACGARPAEVIEGDVFFDEHDGNLMPVNDVDWYMLDGCVSSLRASPCGPSESSDLWFGHGQMAGDARMVIGTMKSDY